MLEVAFLVGILYPFLLQFIERRDIHVLKETSDVNISLSIRKKIKRNRILLLVTILILYSIVLVVINWVFINFDDSESVSNMIRNIVLSAVCMFSYLVVQNGAIKAVGTISTVSKQEFLANNAKYVLFLRGFEDDDYNHEPTIKESVYNKFSEYEFASLVSQDSTICAVGMTKEITAPQGAIRVYLDDSNWMNDVQELMRNAQKIYILVNDRDSCVWEIEQSVPMLDKTVYIVCDPIKYENVRLRLIDSCAFPMVSEELVSENTIAFISYADECFRVNTYENSIRGYSSALKTESIVLKKNKKRKKLAMGFLIVMFSPLLIILIIYILFALFNDKSKSEQYFDENVNTEEVLATYDPSISKINVDSLDFMIVYYNQDGSNIYTSKHLDSHAKQNFDSFLNSEQEKINESPLVFLLYDGSPDTFIAVQKAVSEKNIGYTRLFDALQLISWYIYRKQPDGVYKCQLGSRVCEFDNYKGLIEVISCEYIGNDVEDDLQRVLWSSQNMIALSIEACDSYKREVIDSKDSGTLLQDVIPFDVKFFGINVINKNTTINCMSSIDFSIDFAATPFLAFELSSLDKSNNILVPLSGDLRGNYKILLQLNTSGDLVVSIVKSDTGENVYSTSLRYYY